METARLRLVGMAMEELAAWARQLSSHRRFPYAELDLSRSQVEVLFLVAHARDGLTPGALARELKVTPGAVTQLVAGLVESGLLEPTRDPLDARRRVLSLTEGSRIKVERFEQEVVGELAGRFDTLDDDELDTLIRLLARTRETPLVRFV